ncbi:MAG: chitobiase/beta-hexosaminidase C-terminal domain-containing protein [Prevotella sp.]|nr:chitobiase/beta-hexosaminidase C-terminal domain-containing protein [Prevotella sp.]
MKKFLLSLVVMVLSVLSAYAGWEKTTTIAVGDVVLLAVENANGTQELSGVSSNLGTCADYTTTPEGVYPLTVVEGASEGTFAFKNDSYYLAFTASNKNYLNTSETLDDKSSWNVSFNEDGTVKISNVAADTRVIQWNYNNGNSRFACYTSNQVLPILWKQVEDGALLAPSISPKSATYFETQSVTISAEEGATIHYTLDGTDPTAESAVYAEALSISETTTVKAIAVKDDKTSSVATATITFGPVYDSFAAANAAAVKDRVVSRLTFTEALVLFVNGQNAYIQDATGAMMLYGANELKAGDKISGYVQGELYLYNGLPEVANFTLNAETVSSDNEVVPTVVDAAALAENPLAYVSQYVQVSPAKFAESQEVSTKTNLNFTVGETALVLRNNFTVEFSVDAEKEYTVAGIVNIYNGQMQLYPLSADDIAENVAPEPVETAIVNGNFSQGKVADNHICTYAKDVDTNGTTYSNMLEVEGWTPANNGDGRAAGIMAYGSEKWIGGAGYSVPAFNPAGVTEGTALGVVAVWSADAQYTQTATFAPGYYLLTTRVNNVGGATATASNLFGAHVGEADYFAENTTYAVNQWTRENVLFQVEEAAEGFFSVGYKATNAGNAAQQHLFYDEVAVKVFDTEEARTAYLADLEAADKADAAVYAFVAARAAKTAAIEALAPVGDELFQYSQTAIDDAKAAVAAAENLEAVEAVVMPAVNAPDAEKQYTLQLKEGGMYMAIADGIQLSADEFPFSFEAVEGGYALKNGENYVAFTGTGNNTWTMSATAEPYAWTFNNLGEGFYTIAKATKNTEYIGVDNTEAGSSCYANKGVSDKSTWALAEYVAPEVFTITVNELANGEVVATPTEGVEGTEVTLEVTPAEGYILKSLTVTSGAGQTVEVSEDNKFVMPAGNVTIAAVFIPTPVIADGVYYLKNVGTGKYLAAGSSWGTHAVVDEFGLDYTIAELEDGKYTLDSQVSNGGNNHFLNGEWSDGAAFGWTLAEVADAEGTFTISNGENYLTAGENDIITLAGDATAAAAQWQFVTSDEFLAPFQAAMETASEETPADATYLVKGANFNRNDLRNNAWVKTNAGGNVVVGGPSADRATYGCEFWNNTFDLHQTIENIPNGYYKFSITGFGTNGTTVAYANDVVTPFAATESGTNQMGVALDKLANGDYATTTTDVVTVVNHTLTIGVKRETNQGSDWTVIDNARLTYFGPIDITVYKEALDAAVKDAQAVEGTVPAAAYEALAAVVTEQNKEYETSDEYEVVIAAVEEAIATAKALQGIYAQYPVVKEKVQALKDQKVYKENAAKTEAFDAAVAAQDKAVELATEVAGVEAAIAAVKAAGLEFVSHVELIEDGVFDLTDAIITNPAPNTSVEGWTVAGGNASFQANCGEFWNAAGASIKQTLAGLPAGNYTLTAVALTRTDMVATLSANENTKEIVTVGSDDVNNRTQADAWFNEGNGVVELPFELAEAGDVEIGLTADTENGDHWLVWRSFNLKYTANGYLEPIIAEYGEIPTEETTFGADDDKSIDIATDYFTIAKAQDVIKVTVAEVGEEAQIAIYDKNNAAIDGLTQTVAAEQTEVEFALTEEQIAAILGTGAEEEPAEARALIAAAVREFIHIKGKNLTVNKVELVEYVEPKSEEELAYEAALAALEDGKTYRISVSMKGETYYLKSDGYLTDNESQATTFTFNAVNADGTLYATGWNLNCKFTNPTLSNGSTGEVQNDGHIHTQNDQNRNNWERQVFFLKDGKYAVRATNANSENWGANTYWAILDGAEMPEAGYSLEPAYDWDVTLYIDQSKLNSLVASLETTIAATDSYTDESGTAAATATEALAAVKGAEYTSVDQVNEAIEQVLAIGRTFFAAIHAIDPIDVSEYYITNPSPIAHKSLPYGWEGETFGDSSNGVSEYWNKAAVGFHQTITLPAGDYKLTVVALQRTGMKGYVYVDENKTEIAGVGNPPVNNRAQAAAWFAEGNGINEIFFKTEEAGDHTIGLTTDDTTGDHWTVWQSFKLEKINDILEGIRKQYEDAVASVYEAITDEAYQNILGNGVETAALREVLPAEEPTTREGYEAAIEAINTAFAAWKASAPSYDQLMGALDYAALFGVDKDAELAAIGEDATYSAAKAVEDAVKYKTQVYDIVAENYTSNVSDNLGDWTDVNIGDNRGQHYDGTSTTSYMEQKEGWGSTSWSASRTQTVTLPKGSYVLKVAARSSVAANAYASVAVGEDEVRVNFPNKNDAGFGIDTEGNFTFAADATYANNGNGRGWEWIFVPFTLAEDGEATITFAGNASAQYQWMSFTSWAVLVDPETTGINGIRNNGEAFKNAAVYDLSGRKVQNPTRGMYIVNGKKVVIK